MKKFGSRSSVMHGNSLMTAGGLRKKDLKYNKHGKIVSKKLSMIAEIRMDGGASHEMRYTIMHEMEKLTKWVKDKKWKIIEGRLNISEWSTNIIKDYPAKENKKHKRLETFNIFEEYIKKYFTHSLNWNKLSKNIMDRAIIEEFSRSFKIKYDFPTLTRVDTYVENNYIQKYFIQVFAKLDYNETVECPNNIISSINDSTNNSNNDSKMAIKMWFYIDENAINKIESTNNLCRPLDFKDKGNYFKGAYIFFIESSKLIEILGSKDIIKSGKINDQGLELNNVKCYDFRTKTYYKDGIGNKGPHKKIYLTYYNKLNGRINDTIKKIEEIKARLITTINIYFILPATIENGNNIKIEMASEHITNNEIGNYFSTIDSIISITRGSSRVGSSGRGSSGRGSSGRGSSRVGSSGRGSSGRGSSGRGSSGRGSSGRGSSGRGSSGRGSSGRGSSRVGSSGRSRTKGSKSSKN